VDSSSRFRIESVIVVPLDFRHWFSRLLQKMSASACEDLAAFLDCEKYMSFRFITDENLAQKSVICKVRTTPAMESGIASGELDLRLRNERGHGHRGKVKARVTPRISRHGRLKPASR